MDLKQIKDFISEKGISVTDLSNRINRQRSYISAILSGKKPLSEEIRQEIVKVLEEEGFAPASPITLAEPVSGEIMDGLSKITRDLADQVNRLSERSSDFSGQLDYLKMIVTMLVKEQLKSMPQPHTEKREIPRMVQKEPDLSIYVGLL